MSAAYQAAAAVIRKLADEVAQRVADEKQRVKDGLTIKSPLTAAAEGGALFNGTRPYAYLTKDDFACIADIDALLPWSDDARKHLAMRTRRDAVERVLAKAVETPTADMHAELEEVVKRLEAVLQEYVFLFPLDNVELPDGCDIRIGRARLRALDGDWKRFCGETYAAVENLVVSKQDKGAILANRLIHEEELRDKEPVLEVRAWGSPESAYQAARDEAHVALAVLKFFARPFDEKSGQVIALKGENQERRRGWRVRYAAGDVVPDMWSDGTGPGLPFRPDPPSEWTQGTKEFMQALNNLLDADPRTDVAKRLTTAVFWIGSALNQPVLTREGPAAEGGNKPAGIEVGRRIRDLVTATAAVLKKRGEPGDKQAVARLGEIVQALDPKWHAKHWPSVDAAYKARKEWTHEGVGTEERVGAEALAVALQAVVPFLVIDGAKGTLATVDQLVDWKPPKGAGAP